MGAERARRWGPDGLLRVLGDQLAQHGFVGPDAAASCAEQLAASVGPAARASLFVDLGACKFLSGDVAGAIASWRQAVVSGQIAPASRALFNLGLLHEHLELFDQAIELFESAIAHNVEPYVSHATLAMARADHAGGNETRAMATMARLADSLMLQVPENPLLGETLLGLGEVAEAAGQMERAEQAYRAAGGSDDDRVRDEAALALVRILRFIGHDEEAHQLVESSGLAVADPTVMLDRVELLARLGRVDEALVLTRDVETAGLSVHDRFRLVGLQLDLALVNEAIDGLEELGGFDAPETRARAAFSLGEVYLTHDMGEPAVAMFETVRQIQPGYWADKAALVLGDLAMARGNNRIAAAHWADAAGSRVDSISTVARERLVDAVDMPQAELAAPSIESIEDLAEAAAPEQLQVSVPSAVIAPANMASPLAPDSDMVEITELPTEAVDVLSLDDLGGYLDAVEEPAEPAAHEFDVPVASDPVAPTPIVPEPQDVQPVPEPEPSAPIVIALRRRSEMPDEAAEVTAVESDSDTAEPVEAEAPVASAVPEPTIIALGGYRSTPPPSSAPATANGDGAPDATVIDLREDTDANPYASLAPEALEDDPSPSPRNPYAELAPNFDGPAAPWPADGSETDPDPDADDGSSTFSRFA